MTARVTEPPARVTASRMAGLTDELGQVGALPGGGLARFTYDPAWARAADLVARRMGQAGLAVRRDQVGNVIGRVEGSGHGTGTVLTGSHLDTVESGGRYDGALGVLAGLAAVELLIGHCGQPVRPIEVVALCEEEGSRFHANFLGSRAMLGTLDGTELDTMTDADGVSAAQAMIEVGLDPGLATRARRTDVDTFVELHIEQGATLHRDGVQIGVVEAITGLAWLEVTVDGRADHAGTTPMDSRRDAMQGAAAMTTALTELAVRQGPVLTCGRWDVRPGGANIVPSRVVFSVDVRHPDHAVLRALVDEVAVTCRRLAGARGLRVDVREAKYAPPAPMDDRLRDVLAESATACGASWRALPSLAGHDSQMWAPAVPTAMVFVPSVDGRSHCPEEFTPAEDCARGATVLATALHHLAYP